MSHLMDTILHLGDFLDLILVKWRNSPWKQGLLKVMWSLLVILIMVSMPQDYSQIQLGHELRFSEKQLDKAIAIFQGPQDYVALTTLGNSRGEYFQLLKDYRFTKPSTLRDLITKMSPMDRDSEDFKKSVVELKNHYAEYVGIRTKLMNIYEQHRMDLIMRNIRHQQVSNLEGRLHTLRLALRQLEHENDLLKLELNRPNFL